MNIMASFTTTMSVPSEMMEVANISVRLTEETGDTARVTAKTKTAGVSKTDYAVIAVMQELLFIMQCHKISRIDNFRNLL